MDLRERLPYYYGKVALAFSDKWKNMLRNKVFYYISFQNNIKFYEREVEMCIEQKSSVSDDF